jgi:DNA-binding beta-propeller fold protein YncE
MKATEKMTSRVNSNEEYTFIQDINVKSDTDEKDWYILGMTLVSDSALVLCDYENQCLKLVDINESIIKDILILQSWPFGITSISNDQIVVALADCYQIQLVSVRDKLTLDRSIKTNGKCLDVKMMNNQLYLSFWKPVKFQILQLTGAIIKTIKPDDEILKQCTLPSHIAVSQDESVIYVSDWKTNKVMSLDIKGNMLALYQGELEHPGGIIISPSGSVYVCNRDQHIVYKMKSDLSEATVILGPGDGLCFPQAMCLNKKNKHLYISGGSSVAKYKNILKVYKC